MCSGSHPFLLFKNCFINHHLSFLRHQSFYSSGSFSSAYTYVPVASKKKKKIPHLIPHLLHLPLYFYLFFIIKHFQSVIYICYHFSPPIDSSTHVNLILLCHQSRSLITLHITKILQTSLFPLSLGSI